MLPLGNPASILLARWKLSILFFDKFGDSEMRDPCGASNHTKPIQKDNFNMPDHQDAKTLLVCVVTIFNHISHSILIKILIFQSFVKAKMKCDWNINILIKIL